MIAVIAVGQYLDSNIKIMDIAVRNKGLVHPAIGIHPQFAESSTEDWLKFIEDNAPNCVGVGEIGLDFWIKREKGGQARQVMVYERLLDIAKRLEKPVFVHSRGAWRETVELARRHDMQRAVFHWFTGPKDVLDLIVESGYLVSASPAVEYSKAHRQSISQAPLENLVLETDAPVKYKGVDAEPADVQKTLKAAAELKGIAVEELAELTTRTASSLLNM